MKQSLTSSATLKDLRTKAQTKGLEIIIGETPAGEVLTSDLGEAGNNSLILGGTQGSGKSTSMLSAISNLILQNSPDELKFILIDPKQVEYSFFMDSSREGEMRGMPGALPHLYTPVVTDPLAAVSAIEVVAQEMLARYELFDKMEYKNRAEYNSHNPKNLMPQLVVCIDEWADILMDAAKEGRLEDLLQNMQKLVQLGRGAGVTVLLATGYPSADYIPSFIKACVPTRICFQMPTVMNSMVVLDQPGAEMLHGKGHGLFRDNSGKIIEFQGASIADIEVREIVKQAITQYGSAKYVLSDII